MRNLTIYSEEIKREDKIKKVNNRTWDRFYNSIIILRIQSSIIRDFSSPFS